MKTLDLKTSKRIAELCKEKGIEPWKSEYCHCVSITGDVYEGGFKSMERYKGNTRSRDDWRYRAWESQYSRYTLEEILDILPWKITTHDADCTFVINKNKNSWDLAFEVLPYVMVLVRRENKDLLQACGELLIYLLENDYITK